MGTSVGGNLVLFLMFVSILIVFSGCVEEKSPPAPISAPTINSSLLPSIPTATLNEAEVNELASKFGMQRLNYYISPRNVPVYDSINQSEVIGELYEGEVMVGSKTSLRSGFVEIMFTGWILKDVLFVATPQTLTFLESNSSLWVNPSTQESQSNYRVAMLKPGASALVIEVNDNFAKIVVFGFVEKDLLDSESIKSSSTPSVTPTPNITKTPDKSKLSSSRAKFKIPSEQWNKTTGTADWDVAYSVQQTSDGGYIIACSSGQYGTGSSVAWFIKADANGNWQFGKGLNWEGDAEFKSVQQTSDAGYIFAGTINKNGYNDAIFSKSDANGNTQWEYSFDSTSSFSSVQQTSDGGYIFTGSIRKDDSDALLFKTDARGNLQWYATFGGGPYNDWASSVKQTADGGYILAGYKGSYGVLSGDAWLIKTDTNGNEMWNKTFGGESFEWANSVQQTSDGGYIIAGVTGSYGAGGKDAWLIKTDTNGNEMWNKTFGGKNSDEAKSVQQTSDGGYIMAGFTESFGAGKSDAWLIKTDTNGNEVWNKTFGGAGDDSAYSVQQTSDGGYIMAGSTESYGAAGKSDIWLIKVSS